MAELVISGSNVDKNNKCRVQTRDGRCDNPLKFTGVDKIKNIRGT